MRGKITRGFICCVPKRDKHRKSIKNESTVQGVSVFVSPCAVPFRNVLCAVLFILLVEFHYGFYSFSENVE